MENNHKVHKQRHVLYIIEVIFQFFDGILYASAVGVFDLGPSRYPGLDGESLFIIGHDLLKLLYKKWALWSRANEIQVSFEYIPQLGQFIDAELSENLTDPSNPRIVIASPYRPSFLFCIAFHGAKLVKSKYALILPNSFLIIQDWAFGI